MGFQETIKIGDVSEDTYIEQFNVFANIETARYDPLLGVIYISRLGETGISCWFQDHQTGEPSIFAYSVGKCLDALIDDGVAQLMSGIGKRFNDEMVWLDANTKISGIEVTSPQTLRILILIGLL